MKERPILFSAPMVRALLDGSKTQTRRVAKHPLAAAAKRILSYKGQTEFDCVLSDDSGGIIHCPYGQPGDRLWVKETHLAWWSVNPDDPTGSRVFSHVAAFAADGYELEPGERWIPSIHMRRIASRITLEITGVRVERLQDISEKDAIAEGTPAGYWEYLNGESTETAKESYECLWVFINGAKSFEENPWVWVIDFKVVKP